MSTSPWKVPRKALFHFRRKSVLFGPGDSRVDDPTGAYRAVKYAVRLGFLLEQDFRRRLTRARKAGAFKNLSGDRIRRGFEEILLESEYEKAQVLMHRLRLFGDVLPAWF